MKSSGIPSLVNYNSKHRQQRPKPETKIGRVYDLLMTGEFIKRPQDISSKVWMKRKCTLQDFWGLELESDRKLGTRCIGIWDGPYLVPIERLCQPYD